MEQRTNVNVMKMLQIFLEQLTFDVSLEREDDGSVTGGIEELDLFANAESEEECLKLLFEDMKEYAKDFYDDFDLWSSAPNRKKHIPYVIKILLSSDERLLGAMRCRHGRN